jgi:hypothetical protein
VFLAELGTFPLLFLPAQAERGDADRGQRQHIDAAIYLQASFVDQAAADTLQLPLKRDLGLIEVDRGPD